MRKALAGSLVALAALAGCGGDDEKSSDQGGQAAQTTATTPTQPTTPGPPVTIPSYEEAAKIANDSNYGLAAGIFTSDIDRAMRFARDIQAGYVMINEYFTGGPGSPFGGYKQSGIGRERGLLALQNYTQVKNVVVKVGGSSTRPESQE